MILFVFTNSSIAQRPYENNLKWKKKLKYSIGDLEYIGNNNSKVFFVKERSKKVWHHYFKKPSEVEFAALNPKNQKFKEATIQVELKNWFYVSFVQGEKIHLLFSSYDKKTQKISYWHTSMDANTLKESSPMTLIGSFEKKIKSIKENKIKFLRSGVNSKTNSTGVFVYNTLCTEGFILVMNNQGEILKKQECNPLPEDIEYERRKTNFLQVGLSGEDNTAYVLTVHQEYNNKMRKSPLTSSQLLIKKIQLNTKEESFIRLNKNSVFYISGIFDTNIDKDLIFATLEVKGKKSEYILYKIDENEEVSVLDKIETDYGEFLEKAMKFSRDIRKFTTLEKLNNGKTLFLFSSRRIESRSKETYDDDQHIRCLLVDTKKSKIEWGTKENKIIYQGVLLRYPTVFKYIFYERNGTLYFLNGRNSFCISLDGKVERIEEIPRKIKPIKKKITLFAELGYMEREDDIIVFGINSPFLEAIGSKFYYGTYAK